MPHQSSRPVPESSKRLLGQTGQQLKASHSLLECTSQSWRDHLARIRLVWCGIQNLVWSRQRLQEGPVVDRRAVLLLQVSFVASTVGFPGALCESLYAQVSQELWRVAEEISAPYLKS